MNESTVFPRLRADEKLGEDHGLEVTEKVVSDRFLLHCHDYFEIEIVAKGRGTHMLNGTPYPLTVGSAYLLKPTDIHEILVEEDLHLFNISFRETMLGEGTLLSILHSDLHLLTLEGKRLESVLLAARLLKNECEERSDYQKSLLEYLVHFFVDPAAYKQKSEQLSGIKRALLYLEVHFREQIDLATLAREAGFHPMYFSAIFKKTTGETYVQKLTQLRLEYARTLLSNNYSVSYACFESGFGSLSNFFTAFKKKYGVSPREYARSRGNMTKDSIKA